MLHQQTIEKLHILRLRGMLEALEEQSKQPEASSLSFEERLGMLVDAEWLQRQNRALARRLKHARLKQSACLEDINYRHARELDRSQMRSLVDCQWVVQHQNVLITGPTGIGKTYICCALLEKACREGYTVSYARAPRFFRELSVAYVDGSFDRLLTRLARTDVLAVDDWGLVALNDAERRYFLEVIEDRHGSRSTVLTSQFPVETWHDLIGNPSIADATVDRLVSNAHRIELKGESLRRPEPGPRKNGSTELDPSSPAQEAQASRSKGRKEVKP
ncbi:MAG: ATP-binding protein [Acidobacteria bacterium]|nr:ATP-binding protein [Acidobacteriota bacterium]